MQKFGLRKSLDWPNFMTESQIETIFTYRRPFGDQPLRYEGLRAKARELALLIQDFCPESREKSLAITHLQQVIMWANASIAINEIDKSVSI